MQTKRVFTQTVTYVAVQIVYYYCYILTPLWNVCDMLNFDTFVLSKKISQYNEQPKDSLWH